MTSYWHMFFRLQDFSEVEMEQSLTRFTKHAKLFFLQQVTEKDLQPAKKSSEQIRKKARFLGSLGWQAKGMWI